MNNKSDKWFEFLTNTREKNINYERISSIKSISSRMVYEYILRCLKILELDKKELDKDVYNYVLETIKWSDVSKTGSKEIRKEWRKKGFDLFVHNIGSSEIYVDENSFYDEVVRILIKTHGLIGQYLKGEVNLDKNKELYELLERKLITKDKLRKVLIELNKCIIGGVSLKLYDNIKEQVIFQIDLILNNKFTDSINLKDKIKRLNNNVSDDDLKILEDKNIKAGLKDIFGNLELWYFSAALNDFSFLEQVKILLFIRNYINKDTKHITFERLMKSNYIDYKNKKVINIYKKRIIEYLLNEITIKDILENNIKSNPHIDFLVRRVNNTLIFDFLFSKSATKLIEFCEVAYTSSSLYNKAVYMLYDLLGFRKDKFDRFYNEADYLATMNLSLSNKKVLLNYLTGTNILDVGPGGGVLLNLIEDCNKDYNLYGIDISSNVIEELHKKKIKENRKWNLIKGDALYLDKYFEKGSIDTIIFSSIIHELFSYINYEGKRFNINTVIKALISSYNIIPCGGRILIRDGIMTEEKEEERIIEFKDVKDLTILDRYCHDFKGRKITYEKVDDNKVKMLVNDAMEFLYTYTWGEESYSLEVQEQFGYLTLNEYQKLIKTYLPKSKIIECKAFLQVGYEENLLNKITIYNKDMKVVELPDSTCIIVIEKEGE